MTFASGILLAMEKVATIPGFPYMPRDTLFGSIKKSMFNKFRQKLAEETVDKAIGMSRMKDVTPEMREQMIQEFLKTLPV